MKHGRFSVAAAGAAVATFMLVSGSASAQRPSGPENWGWDPGMMMGPGMMRGGFAFTCNPRAAGFAEWRIKRIEFGRQPERATACRLERIADGIHQGCGADRWHLSGGCAGKVDGAPAADGETSRCHAAGHQGRAAGIRSVLQFARRRAEDASRCNRATPVGMARLALAVAGAVAIGASFKGLEQVIAVCGR